MFGFLNHEGSNVSARDEEAAVRKVAVHDAIGTGDRAIGEAGRADDGPGKVGLADGVFHAGHVRDHLAEEGSLKDAAKEADIRKKESGRDELDAGDGRLAGGGGEGAAEVAAESGGAQAHGTKGREDDIVAGKGRGDLRGVEEIALDDLEALMGEGDFFGRANVGGNVVAMLKGETKELAANAARGAENEEVHKD